MSRPTDDRPGVRTAARAGRGRGRPPGAGSTRAVILSAARQEFAERGFGQATVRGIAGRAGVDPAMIKHHFGSKHGLFTATLDLPFDPAVAIGAVLDGPREQLAERLVSQFLQVWDSVDEAAAALVRTAMTEPARMGQLRDFVQTSVIAPLLTGTDLSEPERRWRGSLIATTMIGLIMSRYVIRFEPLASAGHADVVAAIAPALQRHLSADTAS